MASRKSKSFQIVREKRDFLESLIRDKGAFVVKEYIYTRGNRNCHHKYVQSEQYQDIRISAEQFKYLLPIAVKLKQFKEIK